MRAHPGRTLSVMVIAAVGVAVALGLVLAVEPAAEPAVLLVGVMAGLILYGVMYVVERKHHWSFTGPASNTDRCPQSGLRSARCASHLPRGAERPVRSRGRPDVEALRLSRGNLASLQKRRQSAQRADLRRPDRRDRLPLRLPTTRPEVDGGDVPEV